MGEISIWTLGSKEEFLLFVAAGPVLPRVQNAEGFCLPGDIVVDQNVYNILKDNKAGTFKPVKLQNGYVKVIFSYLFFLLFCVYIMHIVDILNAII